jgi:hypothetical protein
MKKSMPVLSQLSMLCLYLLLFLPLVNKADAQISRATPTNTEVETLGTQLR